jgi:hypothetical protein
LFDVAHDIAEKKDVSGEQPEIAARMAGAWDAWNAKMAASAWPDHIYHVRENRPWR